MVEVWRQLTVLTHANIGTLVPPGNQTNKEGTYHGIERLVLLSFVRLRILQ